jgi:fructan beta-fructosidase
MNDFRPALHFTARSNWLNDPNGLIFIDGRWHMFFQHNPAAMVHGPMHWGHAISTDLAQWEELPIALYPDALGECFSGSAVAAAEGTTGEGIGRDEILLFYTAHQKTAEGKDHQTQCLAIANRELTTFRRHPANPLIPNPGLHCFRDPKVIWHAPTARWVMVVTEGQAVRFYSSADALDWRHDSSFGADRGFHNGGPWECPDIFSLPHPATGAPVWVLAVGAQGARGELSRVQYFLGDFDGGTFTGSGAADDILWLDHGPDCYATQSWAGGTPQRTSISWMSNLSYAGRTPTTGFRGAMTLPHELKLVETPSGLRIAQTIPAKVDARFERLAFRSGSAKPSSVTYRLEAGLAATEQEVSVELFGGEPILHLRREAGAVAITVSRRGYDGVPALKDTVRLAGAGDVAVTVYVDNGHVEIVAMDGLAVFSVLCFPTDPLGPARIDGG